MALPVSVSEPTSNGVTQPAQVIKWQTALTILDILQKRVSHAVNATVEFDERHIAYLRAVYIRDTTGFWTVVDQLFDRMMQADWDSVRDPGGFIHSLISKCKPLPCPTPEQEFLQRLLAKLWPSGFPYVDDETPPGSNEDIAASQQVQPSNFEYLANLVPKLEHTYTWDAADSVLEMISMRLSEKIGRVIHFDEKHRAHIHARFDEDPLGFWSVLDQIQDRMMQADWTYVRNDARFIQSFLGKFRPLDLPLSDFMSGVIPEHPAVSYGMPPHVLLTAMSGVPPTRQPGIQAENGNAPDKHLPFTWDSVLLVLHEIEVSVQTSIGQTIHFDEKHKTHLRHHWNKNPSGIYSILDQVHERLLQSDWKTIRDSRRFIQSLVNRYQPRSGLSEFMRLVIPQEILPALDLVVPKLEMIPQQPSIAPNTSAFEPKETVMNYSQVQLGTINLRGIPWERVIIIIVEVERKLQLIVGRPIQFDEKHRMHLKQYYARDPVGFWNLIDQIHNRVLHSDWRNIRNDGRYIQSLITNFHPQPGFIISEFLLDLIRKQQAFIIK